MPKYLKTNLHPVLLRFLKQDDYDHPEGYSATSLIDATKVVLLSARHKDELVFDPRMAWKSRVGSSVHAFMEGRAERGEETERRLYAEVNGYKVSGKFDLLRLANGDCGKLKINDYKTLNPFTFLGENGEPSVKVVQENGQVIPVRKFVDQFSIYRWLLHENGTTNVSNYATVHCFVLGWQKNLCYGKFKDFYPLYDCFSGEVPLLSVDDTRDMVAKALGVISKYEDLPDEELPDCEDHFLFAGKKRCAWSKMPDGRWQMPWCPVWRWCKQRDSSKDPLDTEIKRILSNVEEV